MLYGCCVNLLPKTLDRIGLEYAGRLKRLGYDYIELPLNELAQLSEQEFRDARTVLDLPCRACNDFMPARFQITGSDITSRAELTDYLRRALERAARLGISFAVFGSPWSRSCPEHYSREAAFGQIAEFLSLAGEEAAPYQVVIAIEPINRGETNMLNHFSDGVRMARTVDHPNVRVLCDYYPCGSRGTPPLSCWTEGESCWSTPTSPSWKAAATPLTYLWSPRCLSTPGSFGRSDMPAG